MYYNEENVLNVKRLQNRLSACAITQNVKVFKKNTHMDSEEKILFCGINMQRELVDSATPEELFPAMGATFLGMNGGHLGTHV